MDTASKGSWSPPPKVKVPTKPKPKPQQMHRSLIVDAAELLYEWMTKGRVR